MLLPDAAFSLLATGVAGCLWELIRPGRIVPGVAGLSAAVFGAYCLWRNHPTPSGLAWIGFSLLVLTGGALTKLYFVTGLAAVIGLSVGFVVLFPAPYRISPLLVIPVCLILSIAAVWLLHTALLAHLHKRE